MIQSCKLQQLQDHHDRSQRKLQWLSYNLLMDRCSSCHVKRIAHCSHLLQWSVEQVSDLLAKNKPTGWCCEIKNVQAQLQILFDAFIFLLLHNGALCQPEDKGKARQACPFCWTSLSSLKQLFFFIRDGVCCVMLLEPQRKSCSCCYQYESGLFWSAEHVGLNIPSPGLVTKANHLLNHANLTGGVQNYYS